MDSSAHLLQFLKNDPDAVLRDDDGQPGAFLTRAPARLDVIGGITDSTGSLACGYPLALSAAVAVQRRDDRKIVMKRYYTDGAPSVFSLSLDDFYGTASLLPNQAMHALFGHNTWAEPLAGAFPILARHKKINRRSHGANIACFSDIPGGCGLGNSTALQCATLCALAAASHLILDPLEIALLAHKLEIQMAAVPAGIMHPLTSVLGKPNHILLMQCQPHEIRGQLPIPAGFAFVAVDCGAKNSSRAAARRGARISAHMAHAVIARAYRDLGIRKDPTSGYLANVAPDLLERYFRHILPETLTGRAFSSDWSNDRTGDRTIAIDPEHVFTPRGAALYHIQENTRVRQFGEYLQAMASDSDAGGRNARAAAAGRLMIESHQSAAINAALTTPETDLLVKMIASGRKGIFGARSIASGNTLAVFMDERASLDSILTEYMRETGLKPTVYAGTSPGAGETPPLRRKISALRC